MSARPPKTRQKIGAQARAELGLARECVECHETKMVNNKTFCLSKRDLSLRGWSTVCRVCQGVATSEAGLRATKATPHKQTPAARNHAATEDLINDMYLCNPDRDRARLEEIKHELTEHMATLARRESFQTFIRVLAPLVAGWETPGPIHDDIIDGLLSEHKRTLIIATRYSAKSTLTSMYVAWEIFNDPLIKILVVSRGSQLAKRMLRVVRSVFVENCPLLEHLVPTEECLDNAEQFQTPQSLKVTTGGATFTSLGVTSNVVGLRSDITIGDDIEGPQEDTPEKVVDLEESLNELHMINPKGRKILLGTFQSEFSLYARLADLTDTYGEPIWEEHKALMFEEDPDDKNAISSRWPAMYTDADALDWRRSVTARGWKLHVMLEADPSMLNEKPLKISDLILLDWDPQRVEFPLTVEPGGPRRADLTTWGAPKGDNWLGPRSVSDDKAPYATTVAAVDPASGLAGRDAIGLAILSVTRTGLGVIRHLEGIRGLTKADNMRRLAHRIRQFQCSQLVVEETEGGFFGETLEGELVLAGYPMVVEKVTTGIASKGRRIIEALAPPMGAGRLVLLEAVARSDHGGEFVNQMVRISYDGRTGKARKDHDDIVDALAHGVAACKHSLISDIADNLGSHHADLLESVRHLPLRWGGLGGSDGSVRGSRHISLGPGGHDGLSMAERLIEEDEVLVKMVVRRDRLQEQISEDLRIGRGHDENMVRRVKAMTKQINELKEIQVL